MKNILQRFCDKVEPQLIGCWKWSAAKNSKGYGYFGTSTKRGTMMAYRFAYEINKGKIPEGMEIDHLCRNTSCVNPNHLEAVTSRENIMRGNGFASINAKKTNCVRGHEFSPKNTIKRERTGARRCRECANMYMRIYHKIPENKEKQSKYMKLYYLKRKERLKT